MYDSLTQKEKWGFEYVALRRGGGATAQSVALECLRLQGNKYYDALDHEKWAAVKQAVAGADPAVVAAIQLQLGISDIL